MSGETRPGERNSADQKKEEPYLKMPVWALDEAETNELTARDLLVYLWIIRFRYNKTGLSDVTREKLAEKTGLHPSSVSESITKLRGAGLIEICDGKGRRSVYRVIQCRPETTLDSRPETTMSPTDDLQGRLQATLF
jgi:DNA-binding transcriptional ArsR family regulator